MHLNLFVLHICNLLERRENKSACEAASGQPLPRQILHEVPSLDWATAGQPDSFKGSLAAIVTSLCVDPATDTLRKR